MIFRKIWLTLLCCILLSCIGCAVTTKKTDDLKRDDFLKMQKIAVLPFSGSGSEEATNAFISCLAEKSKEVFIIEPDQAKKLFDEKALINTGRIDSNTKARLKKFLGAQGLVLGNINVIKQQVKYKPIRTHILTIKIFDIETGSTVFDMEGEGKDNLERQVNIACEKIRNF
jgi:hypothetical protein